MREDAQIGKCQKCSAWRRCHRRGRGSVVPAGWTEVGKGGVAGENFIGFYRVVSRFIGYYRTEEARNYAFSRLLSIGAVFRRELVFQAPRDRGPGGFVRWRETRSGKVTDCYALLREVSRKCAKVRTDQARKSSMLRIVTGESLFSANSGTRLFRSNTSDGGRARTQSGWNGNRAFAYVRLCALKIAYVRVF